LPPKWGGEVTEVARHFIEIDLGTMPGGQIAKERYCYD
jgi:hypothetical protein